MTYRDDLQVPAGAKGWRDARPWSDVEHATVRVLAHQASRARIDTVVGFTLAYVPYSPLGDAEGADLSWEADPHVLGGLLGLAEHPATALEETIGAPPPTGPGTAPVGWDGVLHRWRGWSQLLADLARLSCHLPDPTQVLRTVLGESDDWLSGDPAEHHLADDDTAPV